MIFSKSFTDGFEKQAASLKGWLNPTRRINAIKRLNKIKAGTVGFKTKKMVGAGLTGAAALGAGMYGVKRMAEPEEYNANARYL